MRRFVNDVEMGPRVSSFSPHAAAIKHHGLYNQGATCYLNSVLQVLFMTKDFREAVERNPCEKGDDYIDHQLKTLFHVLKDNTAETRNITRKLGIHRVYEQRDAAEHFDQILSLTSPEASKIFSGLLTHQSECSGCHILTETDGQFWHLPLALVDPCSKCYSVVDGIKEFFKVSFITGENQLFCDHCDAKADATVKCVVKHHPEVLMLLLKRFEFNYRYMTYVKNSCVVDVPYTLQIPENQTYELYAVVDHYGDLRGGHYTATVKSQDDERWYNFNDTRVTLLDYQTFQVDHTESSTRSQSVYLLFYRKNQNAQDMRGESTSGHFSPAASNHDDQKIRERERSGEKRKKKNKNKKKPEDDEGCKHGGSNRLYKEHEQQREERRDDKGHKAQERGDDEPAQRKETFTTKPYLSEGVEDQDKRRFEGVRQNKPEQEISVTHTTYKNVGEEKQAKEQENKEDKPIQSKETKRRAELAERGRLTENQGAQSAKRTRLEDSQKKKENSQTKHLNRAAEYQDSERLDNVKNNINEDEGHKQEVGQDYSLQTVGVDKTGDEEKMELDVTDDEEEKTGADKVTSGKRQQLTQSGLYTDGLQNDGSVGESKKNEPEDDEGCKHGGSNRLYKGHEQQRKERRDDKGHKEQERGDDEPAQRKETFTTKPYLSESVEDQDKRRFDGVRQNRPEQEVSVTHTTYKNVGEEKQAKEQENKEDKPIQSKETKRRAELAERGRLTENQGAQSAERTRLEDSQKKKENSQTKHLNRAAEYQDSERLDNVKNNINEDEGHKQEVGQDYSLQTVGVDKTGDEEKMELDVKDDEEGKTGRRKLTIYELYTDGLQNNESVGDGKKNEPEDDWGVKHGGSNRLYKGYEQQREERRDDKGQKEQERGDDEPAQRKETFTTKPYLSESVEDQDKRRFDGVRQNRPEQEISVTHTTSKNVGEEKQAKEQENKEDKPIQSRETKRRAELAERGRLTENQGAQSAERTRLEDSQKKKENSQTKHLNRAAECQDSERLDNVKNNINEDEGQKQEVGQDYSLQTVGVDKTGDEEKMELDVKDDEEGKTGADKVTSGKRQQLTQSGLYTDGLQNDGSVGESKKNEPEDDEGCKHGGNNRFYKGHEQQREERRDDKGQKEQERGDDEPAQRKETFTTKPYLSEGVEDQDKRRFDGVRQNRPEQEISVTHTTSRGRLTENQGAQSAEIIETLQETSQPHIRNQVKNERSPDRKSDPKTDVGNSQRNGKKKKNWKIRGCPQCLKSKTKD
ncbi:trichohyalin-like isoform X2 [Trachinotus anak]|uniref:trichohyalin-like isoform X2 n=1 Tax=Trachinotus anak TaxID=443729 RepID=UPI0039F24518